MSTLELSRAYVAAYAAWWYSLMTPPFNKKKSAEHEALAVKSHEAWVTFETSRETWATLGESVQGNTHNGGK
jgi:ferric iron reductase protein FhuF